jgi:hypothetical protein
MMLDGPRTSRLTVPAPPAEPPFPAFTAVIDAPLPPRPDADSVAARRRGLAFLAGVGLLLWILFAGRPPRPTLMWTEAYDLGHIPLFGLMAVCLFEASRSLLGSRHLSDGAHYLVAFVSVAVISLLSELAQLGVA